MPKAVRAEKITIDLPRQGQEAWIRVVMQHLDIGADGAITSISGRQGQLFRQANSVALEMLSFVDPVTRMPVQLSVGGLANAISVAVKNWALEDFDGAEFDEDHGRVVINAN